MVEGGFVEMGSLLLVKLCLCGDGFGNVCGELLLVECAFWKMKD